MRVAELAALTGTTVRTVRYYHHLGMLPVPAQRAGWRDYDLGHLARLSRIRWLAEAGVPLEAIGRLLDDASTDVGTSSPRSPEEVGQSTVVEDLSAALECAQERLEEVTRQRDMLVGLLERARSGATVTPMSERMVAFFDRMEARAPDEATRAAVRHDRDVTELACYRGLMPPEAHVLFFDPDEDMDAETILAYRSNVPTGSPAQVDAHARWLVGRLEQSLPPMQLRELARTVDVSMVESVFRLVARAVRADSGDTRAVQAMAQHLVEAIERWRD